MISIIKSLIEEYLLIPSFNVIILGTQETGKTRFFNLIKNYHHLTTYLTTQSPYTPTVGLNTTKFKTADFRLCFWDLGGKKSIRKIWENYYPETHGIIYFVDGNNLQESLTTLKQILKHNEMARIPVLFLTKNQKCEDQLMKFIGKQKEIFFREYSMQRFEFQQVGMLSEPSASIKRQQLRILQLLKWLYIKILSLAKEVKTYETIDN